MKLKAYKIAEMLGGVVEGNDQTSINKLSKIENGDEQSLSFLGNSKYNNFLYTSNASIILVDNDLKLEKPVKSTLIRVENPNESFSQLLNYFSDKKTNLSGISKNSIISKNVKFSDDLYFGDFSICEKNSEIGKNVKIHSQVYIGENVSIGNNCSIGHNTIIEKNVSIGNNCSIGANNIIRNSFIKNGVKILDNCVIGKHGFGFFPKDNENLRYPHIGIVLIEDNCEIGCGSTIDRGSLSNTIIGKNTYLDNQVHIAHNNKIGDNCIIAGQVGFAGSSTLGNNVVIGGQAGVSGHLKVGNNVQIGGGSGVIKDIPDNTKVMGYPAKNLREFIKNNR